MERRGAPPMLARPPKSMSQIVGHLDANVGTITAIRSELPSITPAASMVSLSPPPTKSIGDTESEHCWWWKVPPEVRNMIYAMVYEQARDFETAFRATWREDEEERQLRRNRKDYTPGRFHASFAENLVVSKQYFDEALPYLFNGKTMKLGCWLEVSMLALTKSPVDRYLYTAITSMDIDDARYVIPQNIKSTQDLEDTAWSRGTALENNDIRWEEDMDDAAILQRPHIQAFARVRGISHLQVTKIKPQDLEDSDIIAALYRNLDRAERIVRQLVSREQVISSVSDHPASIAEALAMAKEHEPHRRPSGLELEAQQPSEKLLQDADIPLTPDAFVPLFLSRPHDVLAWVKDALTRLAAQPAKTNATS